MSLKRYLITMGIATIVSSVSWLLVVFFLDPQSGFVGVALFFVSFCLSMFGLASIAGYLLRKLFQRRETDFRLVAISFRQAGLLALLLGGSLFLQSQRLFTWWTALLLLLLVSIIEAFFIARSESRQAKAGDQRGA